MSSKAAATGRFIAAARPPAPPTIAAAANTTPGGSPRRPAGATPTGAADVSDRLTVVIPARIHARLRAYAARAGLTYTNVLRQAWQQAAGKLTPRDDPRHAGGGQLLPVSAVTPAGRRRQVEGRPVGLHLAPGERQVLVDAVAAGAGLHVSDVVSRLLDLWLPSPRGLARKVTSV